MLQNPVARFGLQAMGRMEPTADLVDVANFESQPLPLTVVFWRRHLDGLRVTDAVLHRCPLVSKLFLDLVLVLMLDTLHDLHLGVVQKFVSETFWRIVAGQPWGASGVEVCTRNLKAGLFSWYEAEGIALDRRIADLTVSMLGRAHVGPLKTKAIETITLLPLTTTY